MMPRSQRCRPSSRPRRRIEATGLRTRENVLALINPAILDRARQNDAAPPPASEPPPIMISV